MSNSFQEKNHESFHFFDFALGKEHQEPSKEGYQLTSCKRLNARRASAELTDNFYNNFKAASSSKRRKHQTGNGNFSMCAPQFLVFASVVHRDHRLSRAHARKEDNRAR